MDQLLWDTEGLCLVCIFNVANSVGGKDGFINIDDAVMIIPILSKLFLQV